jgi:hypothetical protein
MQSFQNRDELRKNRDVAVFYRDKLRAGCLSRKGEFFYRVSMPDISAASRKLDSVERRLARYQSLFGSVLQSEIFSGCSNREKIARATFWRGTELSPNPAGRLLDQNRTVSTPSKKSLENRRGARRRSW